MNELTINGRFQGPAHMGNGGYVAGLLAQPLGNQAQVRLHRPAPLDRPLHWQQAVSGHIRLCDGQALIAEASPVYLGLSLPPLPSYTAVLAAQQEAEYGRDHPFPDCFVCGPNRPAGDGLGLRPTYLPDYNLVAATWTPPAALANGDWPDCGRVPVGRAGLSRRHGGRVAAAPPHLAGPDHGAGGADASPRRTLPGPGLVHWPPGAEA
jgi:hypothetical protein